MLCPIGQSNEKPPLQALAKWWEYVTGLKRSWIRSLEQQNSIIFMEFRSICYNRVYRQSLRLLANGTNIPKTDTNQKYCCTTV